jgi:hypothetical protein
VIPGPKIRIVFPEQENAERIVAPLTDNSPQHLPFSTILLHAILLMASDVHECCWGGPQNWASQPTGVSVSEFAACATIAFTLM